MNKKVFVNVKGFKTGKFLFYIGMTYLLFTLLVFALFIIPIIGGFLLFFVMIMLSYDSDNFKTIKKIPVDEKEVKRLTRLVNRK